MNFLDYTCPKCGKCVLRSQGVKFCPYCGGELPAEEKPQPIVCPCCKGTGKIEPWQIGQPWYGSIMTNYKGEGNA